MSTSGLGLISSMSLDDPKGVQSLKSVNLYLELKYLLTTSEGNNKGRKKNKHTRAHTSKHIKTRILFLFKYIIYQFQYFNNDMSVHGGILPANILIN